MFHRKKKDDSPISLEHLITMSKDMGKEVHGRLVWLDTEGQERKPCAFDFYSKDVVPYDEFVARQEKRARERARNYRGGRRKASTERYAFV